MATRIGHDYEFPVSLETLSSSNLGSTSRNRPLIFQSNKMLDVCKTVLTCFKLFLSFVSERFVSERRLYDSLG